MVHNFFSNSLIIIFRLYWRPTDSGSEFPVLMGVVEYQDGTVQMVEPHRIKFHD
jgi:hypothetical protein